VPPTVTKDWTLGEMCFQLPTAIEKYILSHSVSYGAAGAALVEETASLGDAAVMMIGKEQYVLFRFLTELLGCKRALNVGTFTGLSTLAFAEGVGPDGRVTTIDRNAAWVDIARRHWTAAGVSDRIDVRVGEALDILSQLSASRDGLFDIVFIDVDKARVRNYFEYAFALLAPNGLIMIDNALWHGWVLDESRIDANTDGMRKFADDVADDPRLQLAILPVADGITLIRRRTHSSSSY
jgi:predicted O-methyltransferase YrrM